MGAVSANESEDALHGADRDVARGVVGIEDETVDHHPRVRADDDAGVIDEANLSEAVGVGDDGVTHEDVAVGLQHAPSARTRCVGHAVDLDGAAAGFNRQRGA